MRCERMHAEISESICLAKQAERDALKGNKYTGVKPGVGHMCFKCNGRAKKGETKMEEPVKQNTKKCTKCGQEKALSEFGPDKKSKTGYRSQCLQCGRDYAAARAKNKMKTKKAKPTLHTPQIEPKQETPKAKTIPSYAVEIGGHRIQLCPECLRRHLMLA